MSNTPKQEDPDWWNRLSSEEQAHLRRIMGDKWQPSGKPEDEVARAFLETRRRIREIEQRALKKLRGEDDDK